MAAKRAPAKSRSEARQFSGECTDCSGNLVRSKVQVAPDQQHDYDCEDCGMHHAVSNSRKGQK